MRCKLCRTAADFLWSWQPFGPDQNSLSFALPGYHARGFAVVKTCDDCKRRMEAGEKIEFIFKGRRYRWDGSAAQQLRAEER